VGLSILFAAISHHYFERQCLALKDRLMRAISPAPAVQPPG
jgi:hypothetical protein